jgi:hypothetical protein
MWGTDARSFRATRWLKELLLLGRPHLIGIAAHSTNDSPWPVATSNAQSTYGAPCRRGARARRCTWYHYQVPVPLCIAKSRNIRISSWRIHSFATKSRNIRISGRQIHSFAAKSRNIRYPNPIFYIRMVLQKHKISQNILQDLRAGPNPRSPKIRSPTSVMHHTVA